MLEEVSCVELMNASKREHVSRPAGNIRTDARCGSQHSSGYISTRTCGISRGLRLPLNEIAVAPSYVTSRTMSESLQAITTAWEEGQTLPPSVTPSLR